MEKKMHNATLHDVAKQARVSLSTASRVLSGADYPVSSRLRERVVSASKELNYIPNIFGKMLKSNMSEAIGIIVPSLQNPFYNQVIFGIESAAAQSGHEIRLFSSHRSVVQERKNIMTLLHNHIMALIILSIDSNADALKNYISYGGRVALLEADFMLEHSIYADTDCFTAGRLAAEHLLELGHRRIAFLTSPLTKSFRLRILEGVKRTLVRAGCALDEKDIFMAEVERESDTGMYEFETGRQLAERFLERKSEFTAVITINDMVAFGVIQVLTQNGIAIPDDLSVVGFDNITYSEMISPPLTTVQLPSSNMGFTACQMLIAQMEAGQSDSSGMSFQFPCTLFARRSTSSPFHEENMTLCLPG